MEKIKNNKEIIINIFIFLIILIGILVRLINIQDFPNALNCDEASIGYEAFSILNYGIDRNGNHLPVFLKAWGSGQNIMLAWLIIPLIKIFDLSVLSVRLPMAIIGSISVVIFYFLLKRISNKKIALVGLIFFAICPWHIMKSRWGLESNLFPDMILISIYFLIRGLQDKNNIFYYLSFIILGLTVYSYGTSYFFLPLFLTILLITLVKKKEISIKKAIISFLITSIIAIPMVLFVIINTYNLEQINLPFMTIPKLTVNRYEKITSIFSSQFLIISLSNFIKSCEILITGFDGMQWSAIKPFGLFYPFSIIFAFIGIIISFFNNKKLEKENSNKEENTQNIINVVRKEINYKYIFNIWFVVSLIMCFIVEPNINRINIIIIPIIFYISIGIYSVIKNKKILVILFLVIYMLGFVLFLNTYFKQNYDGNGTFEGKLEEVFEYVKTLDKQIIITKEIKEPYIYTLFYTKYNTKDFVKTVKVENENVEFRVVDSFGKYKFENIRKIEKFEKDKAYVIKKSNFEKLNINENNENIKVKEFEKYVVLEVN